MKIALILRRLSTHGGTERFAHGFARWLVEAGHAVDVWCDAVDTPVAGITVRPLAAGGRGRAWRAWALAAAAERVPTDDYEAVLSMVRAPISGVFRAGGGCHRAWIEERGWSLADALEVRLDRQSVTAAHRVVVNSEMAGRDLARWYGTDPDRIQLVRNGVDLERFRPRAGPRTSELGLVFLGSGFARKGLKTAIAALDHLPGECLSVIGADRQTRLYRRQAERLGLGERVRFMGAVERPEVLLPDAKALVLPTRYDPAANAVLEAMACGVPVVTSQSNGAAEILPHPWMAIPDPEDEKALAEVLKAVLEDASLGSACRTVAERYPSSSAYLALWDVLEEARA